MLHLLTVGLSEEVYKQLEHVAASTNASVESIVVRYLREGLARQTTKEVLPKARAWTRPDRVILDGATAARVRMLGEKGEILAFRHLDRAGFSNVKNLNKEEPNFPYADLYAELGTKKYFISVKARNRYEADGIKENPGYKISPKQRQLAEELENQGLPAWIAVSFDIKRGTYSCYFGLLSELEGRHGIKMTPAARKKYRCFAEDAACPWDMSELLNTPRRRQPS